MTMKKLSRQELKFFTSLQRRKERYEQRCFLIEGVHLLDEALERNYPLRDILICQSRMTDEVYQIVEKAEKKNISTISVDSQSLERITTTKTPQPLAAVAHMPKTDHLVTDSALYLYQINDPGNLGTIMRTALWYNLNHLILSPESCDPFNTKTVRASQGAVFSIQLTLDRDIAALYPLSESYHFLVSNPEEKSFPHVKGNFIAFFGSESQGLTKTDFTCKHQKFGIKRKGTGESLNLAVAVGIFLDRVFRD